jgi:methylmalonyl-CoA/ethylmalonyl-CoA epimerase
MTVAGFHHVGILVEDFSDVQRVLGECLGLEIAEPEREPDLGIEILWAHMGEVALEFVRPLTPDSRAAAALRAGQGGVHHVAFAVDDLDSALVELRAAGLETVDPEPRDGSHGSRIAFIAPDGVGGTRIELMEPRRPDTP